MTSEEAKFENLRKGVQRRVIPLIKDVIRPDMEKSLIEDLVYFFKVNRREITRPEFNDILSKYRRQPKLVSVLLTVGFSSCFTFLSIRRILLK